MGGRLGTNSIYLLGAFLGIQLPLDWLFSWPGIEMYADSRKQAQIFLWLVAIHSSACVVLLVSAAFASYVVRLKTSEATFRDRFCFATEWLAYFIACAGVATHAFQWLIVTFFHATDAAEPLKWVLLLFSAYLAYLVIRRVRLREVVRASIQFGSVLAAAGTLVAGLAVLFSANPRYTIPVKSTDASQLSASKPRSDLAPSVILITIDALSALHLPEYGYARETAPNLRAFGKRSTTFLRNYANSNFTTPSVASLMLGYRPWSHRAIQLEATPQAALLGESIPALLKKHGFSTAYIATNHWASPRHLDLATFFDYSSDGNVCDLFSAVSARKNDTRSIAFASAWLYRELREVFRPVKNKIQRCETGRHFDPELAIQSAFAALDKVADKAPFFLWVHFLPPHAPYVAPPPFLGRFGPLQGHDDVGSTLPPSGFLARPVEGFPRIMRDRYDESISYVDSSVGRLLDELVRRGVYDKSIVVISADHGESFKDNYGAHGGPMVYEELIRVPLMIKLPGQKNGRLVSELSEHVDVLPTLLDLVGIHSSHAGEGVSLVPVMSGGQLQRPIYSMNFQQSSARGPLHTGVVAMVDRHWKYVHYFGRIHYPNLKSKPEDALYDLSADPAESVNLVGPHPDVAARMLSAIQGGLRRFGVPAQ